ncbi:MAG: hypothetical protein HQK84_01955 [Nitrospinae bacterium]|nr:hypothetical protein [Nitrospinota bacterium]
MPKSLCEPAHSYENIDKVKINAVIEAMKRKGYEVTGDNPWQVDTQVSRVKLQGSWDETTLTFTVIVTDMRWPATCKKIWKELDPFFEEISLAEASDMEEIYKKFGL